MLTLTQIVHGCVKMDRASQKELYKLFYGFAMSICMRYCSNHDEVKEVVNDGFLKIFRQVHIFEARHANYDASLRGWMKTIFVHTAIDSFRKNKKIHYVTELGPATAEEADAAASSIDRMSYKEIIAVVQRLSPMYRTVFCMYVLDGFKHEEIASQLNIAVSTSKSNLAKAKINIQKMLKEEDSNCYARKAV